MGLKILERSFVRDLFKYVFVAVFALIVDFSSLLVLHKLGMQYLLAATVAFLLGTLVNFALSHGYVFKDPVIKNKTANFVVFVVIGAIGLAVNNVIIWLCYSKAHMGLAVAKLIAVAIVFFWNFLARRQFLYNGHKVAVAKEISFEG